MKKALFLASAFALSAILPSCDKAAELLFKAFESPLSFNVTLPPTAAGEIRATNTVSYNLDAEIKAKTNNQFGADFVKAIYINQIAVTLNNSNATNNLSNFESISLAVSSNGGAPVVLGPFVVPATATTTHTFTVANSPNIRPYFNGQNVTFEVIGRTKTATTIPLQATVAATLKFDN